MLPLYLFCLIVGGGLLLVSLIVSGSDDSGTDGVESHPEGDASGDLHAGDSSWLDARDFLSIRALFYLMAGFGATGLLLESLTDATSPMALTWAMVSGLMAATVATLIYGWARRSESGLVPVEPDYLVGVPARVLIPVHPGQRGKVVAVYGGREIELLARLHPVEESLCPRGAEVVIVDVDGDTALVTLLPSLPSESLLE